MIRYLEKDFGNVLIYHDVQKKDNIEYIYAVHALTGECIGNKLYMFSIENNSLCVVNTETGRLDIEYGDRTKSYSQEYLYIRSISYADNIFFISNRNQNILKYNVQSNRKEILYFENEIMDYVPVVYCGILYLLPMGYSERFIQIEIKTNKITYGLTNYKKQLAKKLTNELFIFGKPELIGEFVYRGSFLEPTIQKMHIRTGICEYISIKGFGQPIRSITFDGNYFWILSKNDSKIGLWNEKNNNVDFVIDIALETRKKNTLYAYCKYFDGKIYIIEKNSSCILQFDIKNRTLINYDCNNIHGFKLKKEGGQGFAEEIRVDSEGTLYFFPFWSNGVVAKKIDGSICFYKTETDKMLRLAEHDSICNESTQTLKNFCGMSSKLNKKNEGSLKIGRSILKTVLTRL